MDTTTFYPNLLQSREELSNEYTRWTNHSFTTVAQQLLERCVESCYDPTLQARGSLGSLYSGALGPLVFLRFHLAKRLKCTDSTTAKKLLNDALEIAQTATNLENSVHPKSHQRITLLEGHFFGAKAMLAAILHQMDRTEEALNEANDLISQLSELAEKVPSTECDVLYGRAGALQIILFLRKELECASLGKDVAVQLARHIIMEGRRYASACNIGLSLLWEWHETKYLGAAHGVVGILHTLLSLTPDELKFLEETYSAKSLIRQTIDQLDSFCWPSGNLQSSVKVVGTRSGSDRLVQWCHGAPGHILLLVKANKIFENEHYLQRARQIADEVVWPRGLLRKGFGLCHGIAGNAYALLAVARSEPSFVPKAFSFFAFSLEHMEELDMVPDRPYSLYEGLGAMCTLAIDLACPDQATFPLYE
jgi:lantibiotic modifying enzyme